LIYQVSSSINTLHRTNPPPLAWGSRTSGVKYLNARPAINSALKLSMSPVVIVRQTTELNDETQTAPEYPLTSIRTPPSSRILFFINLHFTHLSLQFTTLTKPPTNHQQFNTMRFTSILLALPFVASVFAAPVANSDLEVKTIGTYPTHSTDVISIVTELKTSIVS